MLPELTAFSNISAAAIRHPRGRCGSICQRQQTSEMNYIKIRRSVEPYGAFLREIFAAGEDCHDGDSKAFLRWLRNWAGWGIFAVRFARVSNRPIQHAETLSVTLRF